MMIKRLVRILSLCVAAAGIGLAAEASPPTASEYEVKAAFLYNFLKFVEWPPKVYPDQKSPIIIGILGDDPFLDSTKSVNYLEEAVADKIINTRSIVIQRSDRVNNLKNCHILFVSSKPERIRARDLSELAGLSILTVGESENFCQQGGVINFVMQSGKVRFEINVEAAEKAQLRISSKLLNVAKIVKTQSK